MHELAQSVITFLDISVLIFMLDAMLSRHFSLGIY